jgi:cobalt-zinc-cadmium efflux system outer membrane protein
MHSSILRSTLLVSLLTASLKAGPVSISSLVSKVTATHPEVRFYEAEIAAAKGGQQTAATRPNPELETSFGTWRVNDLGNKSDGPSWAVTLSQPVEWPGRIALRKAIAMKQTEVAQLGLEQFKATLGGKVRASAWALMAAQEKVRAAEEVSKRLASLVEVLLQRDTAGPAPRLEARIIQTTTLTLNSEVTKARREQAEANFALNQMLGEKPDHVIEISKEALTLAAPPALESLLTEARKHNFDLRARMLDVEQQGFSVKLAENERWPSFKVSPYVQQQRAESKETQFGIGVSIPLPLFDKNKGNIATAKARQSQAEVMLAAQMRELERQVAAQRSAYASYTEELAKWPADMLDSVQKAAGEADEHYRLGALPLSTYIELQQQSVDAINAVLESQLGALNARATLEQLTGTTLNK